MNNSNSGANWTQAEIDLALRMQERGERLKTVAKALGRSINAVSTKLCGINFAHPERANLFKLAEARWRRETGAHRRQQVKPHYAASVRVPAEVEADRDHRERLKPASVTAALCGDPLPGYSAADRRPVRPRGIAIAAQSQTQAQAQTSAA